MYRLFITLNNKKSPSAEQKSVGSAGGPRVPEAFTAQLKSFPLQISQLIVVYDYVYVLGRASGSFQRRAAQQSGAHCAVSLGFVVF